VDEAPPASAEDGAAPRILHVVTRYQRGGSERRVQDIVRALPEARHELLVGAESDVELALRQTAAERVETLHSLVRQVSPVDDVRALVTLWRRLRSGRYAAVVTHQSKAGVLARAAAAAAHSLSMASFGPGYGRLENALFTRLERLLGRRTAAFCVVGDDLAQRFAALGVPADRLHTVRSGVPLPGRLRPRQEARALLDQRHGTVPGRPLICYVGSLEPRKNPLLLARLLRRLHDDLADPPDLLVLGDGPQRQPLLDELRQLGLEKHAVLTGHLTDPGQVHDAIRGADAVVLLSEVEGLPQVLVQAAACGTPFVAFDVEGVRELVSLGAAGVAVPLDRLDEVAEALAQVLADGAAEEPSADLSSWSAQAISSGYRSVLQRVIAAGSGRRRG
jgi:glycosyltransferase involved in cell wall biosynthesis